MVFDDSRNKNITLPDDGIQPANAIPRKERLMLVLAVVPNPRYFNYRGMNVTVEFTENGPALQDKLIDLFVRQKSGL